MNQYKWYNTIWPFKKFNSTQLLIIFWIPNGFYLFMDDYIIIINHEFMMVYEPVGTYDSDTTGHKSLSPCRRRMEPWRSRDIGTSDQTENEFLDLCSVDA